MYLSSRSWPSSNVRRSTNRAPTIALCPRVLGSTGRPGNVNVFSRGYLGGTEILFSVIFGYRLGTSLPPPRRAAPSAAVQLMVPSEGTGRERARGGTRRSCTWYPPVTLPPPRRGGCTSSTFLARFFSSWLSQSEMAGKRHVARPAPPGTVASRATKKANRRMRRRWMAEAQQFHR